MDLRSIAVIAAAVEANVPVLLWGPPGAGKTSLVSNVLVQWGYDTQIVTGNVREPADFAGLPRESGSDDVVLVAPRWAKRASEQPKAAVVLDELSTSTPAVQAAMLRVVLERYAGDLRIGEHVRFVACANPPEQAADGFDLAAPLANRFCHLDVAPDLALWQAGMTIGWTEAMPDLASLPVLRLNVSQIRDAESAMSSKIATFIAHRPDLLSCIPTDMTSKGRAFPTPRTWEFAARLLSRLALGADAERLLALSGLVGRGPALEFLAWERSSDLPDATDVLRNPKIYNWSDPRLDRTYAVLSSVAAFVSNHFTEKAVGNMWKVFAVANDAGRGDIAAVCYDAVAKMSGFGDFEVPAVAADLAPVMSTIRRYSPRKLKAAS